MKAIVYHRYGSPEVLELADVETPAPGAKEVRVKIHAAVVSTADSAFRKGAPWAARLFTGLGRPKSSILGTEFAGEIDRVGEAVTRFRVGDRVFASSGAGLGAHAEFICLPEDGAMGAIPDGLTYEDAAAVCEGALTALPFLRDVAALKRGQEVLINGASGAVGCAAVQLAKHIGAEVTAVCGSTNVDLVRSLGADHVVDYTREDFTQSGREYDIIFDAVGKSTFSRCRGSLKPGGRYLATVLSWATLVQVGWTSIFGSKKASIAFTGLRPDAEKSDDLTLVRELVEAGALRAVIDDCYPMQRAAEAHRRVDGGHKKGAAILRMV